MKYLMDCYFCKGSGKCQDPNSFENKIVDCHECKGKGVLPTKEGEELMKFLDVFYKKEEIKKEKEKKDGK